MNGLNGGHLFVVDIGGVVVVLREAMAELIFKSGKPVNYLAIDYCLTSHLKNTS